MFKVHLATQEDYQSANPRAERMILHINMVPSLYLGDRKIYLKRPSEVDNKHIKTRRLL